jgi:hypothetical protein
MYPCKDAEQEKRQWDSQLYSVKTYNDAVQGEYPKCSAQARTTSFHLHPPAYMPAGAIIPTPDSTI